MTSNAANEYLKAKVLTATPEQLQLMLFDGALRFCEKARVAILASQFDQSYEALSKAQKILLELSCSLKHDVAPELCKNLSALYTYCYRRLVDANVKHEVNAIDEVIQLMKYQRETWVLLMQQMGSAKAGMAARKIDMPAPDSRMEQRISMSA